MADMGEFTKVQTMQWKDATSYSQNKERIPTSWSLERGGLRITVTSGHIHYPGVWIVRCDPWFNTVELKGVTTAEQAQEAALAMVRAKIDALHSAFAQ